MRKISLIMIMLMTILLAACAPTATQLPAPTQAPAQPTQPPVDNQATVDASVAATLAAQPAPPTEQHRLRPQRRRPPSLPRYRRDMHLR